MNRNIIALFAILSFLGGCYWIMNGASFASRPNCIRLKFNGQVACECDYKTKEEFREMKNNLKADEWEGVIFPDDVDPCKANRELKEAFSSNEEAEYNSENQELTTQQYPRTHYTEAEPDSSEANSQPEQVNAPENSTFPVPLPRTYYSSTQKITLYEEEGLMMDVYTYADSSTAKIAAKISKNRILLDDRDETFEFNDHGDLWLKIPGERYHPLSSVRKQ